MATELLTPHERRVLDELEAHEQRYFFEGLWHVARDLVARGLVAENGATGMFSITEAGRTAIEAAA